MFAFAAATSQVVSCPQDVTLVMDSATGLMDVTWQGPVFVDDQNETLEARCDPQGAFPVGQTNVTCHPLMAQATLYTVKCAFVVTITGEK